MSGLFYSLEVRLHLLPLDSVSCLVIWHVLKDHILFLQYKNKAALRVGVFLIKPFGKLRDLIAVLLGCEVANSSGNTLFQEKNTPEEPVAA